MTGRVTGYRVVLPAGWHRLPADPVAVRPVARRLLLQAWADRPRDATAAARRTLEDELVRLADRAADQGGHELLVSLQEVGGVPLAASAVVSLVPLPLEGEAGLAELAEVSADGALSSEVVALGPHRAVVVARDVALPGADRPAGLPALAAEVRSTRQVSVHLPVPDEPVSLLLSFSTPLVALADPLTELFLAIAATVSWREADTR